MAMTVQSAGGAVDFDPQSAFEAAEPNAFTSSDHNLTINFTSSPPHTNPIWEGLIQSGRNDFVPANTLIDAMNNLDDPRRSIYFTQIDTTGDDNPDAYVGGLYGAGNNYSNYSHIKGPLLKNDFEGMLFEYSEVEFLRSEALVRGWNVSGTGTAEDHYQNAIEADMQYWSNASTEEEITQSEIDSYYQQLPTAGPAAYPATGTTTEQLEAIATQKWLAFYMQGQQAWIEWRRFDHPTLNVENNSGAATEDDIPVRFIYPVDEQNLNEANWEAASSAIGGDETSTLLFWDSGYASSGVN